MAVNSISRNLNKSINLSKVFSLSLRYSIYKVQTVFVSFIFMSAANFYILAHLVEFVKHFLQVFSNSFVLFAVLQAFAFHRTTLIYYHKQFVLSRIFSRFFEFLLIDLVTRRRLAYISTEVAICQALFTKTDILFCWFFTSGQVCLFSGHPLTLCPDCY